MVIINKITEVKNELVMTKNTEAFKCAKEYLATNKKFLSFLNQFKVHLKNFEIDKAKKIVGFFEEYNNSINSIRKKIPNSANLESHEIIDEIKSIQKKIDIETGEIQHLLALHQEISYKSFEITREKLKSSALEDNSYNKKGIRQLNEDALSCLTYNGAL